VSSAVTRRTASGPRLDRAHCGRGLRWRVLRHQQPELDVLHPRGGWRPPTAGSGCRSTRVRRRWGSCTGCEHRIWLGHSPGGHGGGRDKSLASDGGPAWSAPDRETRGLSGASCNEPWQSAVRLPEAKDTISVGAPLDTRRRGVRRDPGPRGRRRGSPSRGRRSRTASATVSFPQRHVAAGQAARYPNGGRALSRRRLAAPARGGSRAGRRRRSWPYPEEERGDAARVAVQGRPAIAGPHQLSRIRQPVAGETRRAADRRRALGDAVQTLERARGC